MLHMKGGRPPKKIIKFSWWSFHLHASLRSEEVILRKVRKVFVGGCHGNDCIHMGTKFHLHVYYTEQV